MRTEHVVIAGDLGTAVGCSVTAAGVTTASSADTFPLAPRNRVLPVVSGDVRIGGVASCSRGVWDDQDRTA